MERVLSYHRCCLSSHLLAFSLRIPRSPACKLSERRARTLPYSCAADRKWGSAYLTRDFFNRIGDAVGDATMLMVAYDDNLGGEVVAGARCC